MNAIKKPRIEVWDWDKLIPYDLNVKDHDDGQVSRIAKSIDEFGWDQPIVVDPNGVIIKGHGRRLAAKKLGITKVPVWVRDDLTEDQIRASRLADNRVAISNIDTDLLQKELADLNFDLNGIFDQKELEFVVADLGEVNVSAFVDDLDSAIEEQNQETAKAMTESSERAVKIDKALGFKTISGKAERSVAMFMAMIVGETGKSPELAFVEFVNTFVNSDKSVVTS